MQEFQATILALESDSCTILELYDILGQLMNSLQCRVDDKFFGSKVNSILIHLTPNEEQVFKTEAEDFLKTAVCYLESRFDFGDNSIFKKIKFLNLKKELFSWADLQRLPQTLHISETIDIDKLYSDYCCLRNIYELLPKDISNDKIWSHFFTKNDNYHLENLCKVVCFVLSIPISNAFCERTFSILNNLYTKERNRMSFDLIKSEVLIRSNIQESCKDFQKFLLTPAGSELVKAVRLNVKYMWQNK